MADANAPSIAYLQRCIARLGLPENTTLNWDLLDQALTHASVSQKRNNEQLEFLGDSVLRLAAAEFLLERYPEASVGQISALRSQLVSDRSLTELAEKLGMESFLQVSKSAAGDKAARASRLADMVEALLGALYLSRGNLSLVRPWIDPHLERLVAQLQEDPALQNYKAALQELTQKYYKALPEYRVQQISHLHGDLGRFQAEVWFRGQCWGKGTGRSIKLAEQAAAQEAYQGMQQVVVTEGESTGETP
jgi:ribonuclease-3